MFFYCKKSKEKVKVYETKKLNIGKTNVSICFKDGKEMITCLYGYSDYKGNITNSLTVAQNYISNYNSYSVMETITNDWKNPKISYTGEILSKEILNTEDFFEDIRILIEE